MVGGEAGVGKTSLVRRVAHDNANDARILWAACDGLFTPQPLAPRSRYDAAKLAAEDREIAPPR
jgi:predicted ATP-dependent serine protease